ncbi:YceI family protein [Kaistella sp. 97-N-M2]|uniref:YceI family protein n=1 Tax=Kaistella sp. 97-N-M2 TaxID=2908645 RepID=UPI001F337568|nr:YceI family protein [Kaistella sp. 97-N-M2]UJF30151.1 YceI family protein [Kaistella sp. 97-N-M2]
MLKKMTALLAVLMLTVSAFAQKVLVNDPAHSRIQFTVVHLGINDITGNFNTTALTINADEKNFVNSKITFSTDINSINTNIEARDTHLKSAEFFDAAAYPKMEFASTSIVKGKNKNEYTMTGNLTMHGVTKPVVLDLIYRGSTLNQMNKKQTYSYQVMGTLKRSDFEIGTKFPDAMVSDQVKIKGDFELTEK